MTVRHPIRGLLGGLLLGLGVALIGVFLSIAVIGTWTVLAAMVAFGLLGVVYALFWPPKQVQPGS